MLLVMMVTMTMIMMVIIVMRILMTTAMIPKGSVPGGAYNLGLFCFVLFCFSKPSYIHIYMYTHLPIPYVIDGKDLREFHKNIVISCYENKIKLKIETRNRVMTLFGRVEKSV